MNLAYRFERSLLLSVIVAAGVLATSAADAQSTYGETCTAAARCEAGACLPGANVYMLGSICLCVAGPDESNRGAPTFCCGAGTICPSAGGTTCRNVDDSTVDICVGPDLNLCTSAGDVLTRERAHDCFTRPGTADAQAFWRLGDCDLDGMPNGVEVAMERDPCCNEDTDLGCCLAVPGADPLACCNDTGSGSSACCLTHGGGADLCCDGEEPVACCADAPDRLGCCEAVATDDATCCVYDADPAACCLDADGEPTICCALEGADDEDACAGIDAGASDAGANLPDAGLSDDAGRPDAGVESDGGASTMDGGAIAPDAGTSFGGGGGCVCTVVGAGGRRSPSPLALLGLALAITIPIFRRR